MGACYEPGKLPADVLAALLGRLDNAGQRILLPPGIGTDATAVAFGDRCLVAATDPITFATDEIGWYAVVVNANDVACLGAEPRWFLATVLLPEHGSDEALAGRIFDDMRAACDHVGAALVGGHTEITCGLDRPIVSATMLGECGRDELIVPGGIRPGDAIIATKGIAIEGTAVLARELGARLAARVPGEALERMARCLHEPGIDVVRDARIARAAGGVHALHDATEGGIATALRELATAGRVGLEIDATAIRVLDETRQMCEALGADPLGLLASGCLLIAAPEADAAGMVDALGDAGIDATRIGRAVPESEGILLAGEDGVRRELPVFERDEVARLLA
ncbi:MAG: AIR synthase family protein [Candidatus Hydrogenedentes bacterium]|nr:AIR synthase family protein [Candidatus Hydrogenedentota bacterium]